MSKKDMRKALEVYSAIVKRVNAKNWNCLYPECTQKAINSHLLQRNGILDNITENGHLIQIKPKDFFKIEKEGFIEFKRLGVNQAISYPLFCNDHDTGIFKSIEVADIDFTYYPTQLLFSYRALCAELKKKQKNVEIEKSIAESGTLQSIHPHVFFERNLQSLKGNEEGIRDLDFFKVEFEKELNNPSGAFIFSTLKFPLIKISLSAIFSYAKKTPIGYMQSHGPLNTTFINAIPQRDSLVLIVGYHKDKKDEWIVNYVESWEKCTPNNLTSLLSDLVCRVETWAMAESLYTQIPNTIWETYKANFISNVHNDSNYGFFNHNVFPNIIL